MTLEDINKHIKCISIKDWNRLFDLIPKIQLISKFGDWKDGETDARVVDDFVNIMYELDLVIDFDWGELGQRR